MKSCTAPSPATWTSGIRTADELLYDLEHYIYHTGYGPTNETLGKFIRELFGQAVPPASARTRAARTQGSRRHSISAVLVRQNRMSDSE